MPKAFIDRVMYIALGKRLGIGDALCFMENVENVDFERGKTTGTNYNKAFAALNLFQNMLKRLYLDKLTTLSKLHRNG
eukprot:14930312-Ditylum_brightwellii.AAC.1